MYGQKNPFKIVKYPNQFIEYLLTCMYTNGIISEIYINQCLKSLLMCLSRNKILIQLYTFRTESLFIFIPFFVHKYSLKLL